MSAHQFRPRSPRWRNPAAGILVIAAVFGVGLIAPATSAAFVGFGGASSDGSKVFFHTDEQLVSGDTDSVLDVYERSGGTTTLVSQGQINGNGALGAFFNGASSDGSKVFFTTTERLASSDTDSSQDIYERSGGTTTQVTQGEVNGNGAFEANFGQPGTYVKGSSSDGSKVFFGTSEQLAATDTDARYDIYERSGGTTTQVTQGQINGNGPINVALVGTSSDGSKVFFRTNEQLVSGDTDGVEDVYERSGGTTTQLSLDTYDFVAASSDGSKVFFRTFEQLAATDTDSSLDIYERSGGTTTQVTQGQINGNGAFDVGHGALLSTTSDGSKVFFVTDEQLVSGDSDSSRDLYERSGGTTTQVSQGQINGNGAFPVNFVTGASSDGSKVFFHTDEQLVSGDTDSANDVYERSGGTTTLVSHGQINGNDAFGAFFNGASSDGSKVFFGTSEQLVSGDTDSANDVYERSGGTTTLVSQGQINGNGALGAFFNGASSDGSKVFFMTDEQLVSGDTDSDYDIDNPDDYDIYERSEGTTKLVSADAVPPQTTIESGTSGTTNDPTPTFGFSSSEPGSTFECKVDLGSYAACSSPRTTAHLEDGPHTLSVRATDPVGNLDPTPATRTFTVRTASVSVSGSTLLVTAAPGAKDNLRISSPAFLRVTDLSSGAYTGSGVHAGAGCTRRGDYTVDCPASGITLIRVTSGDQNDRVVNSTAVKSSLHGGAANDVLNGGSANDTLTGAAGADVFFGMAGNDQIFARDLTSDKIINCGGGTADKADLDLLPNDPDDVIAGCETKTRH